MARRSPVQVVLNRAFMLIGVEPEGWDLRWLPLGAAGLIRREREKAEIIIKMTLN